MNSTLNCSQNSQLRDHGTLQYRQLYREKIRNSFLVETEENAVHFRRFISSPVRRVNRRNSGRLPRESTDPIKKLLRYWRPNVSSVARVSSAVMVIHVRSNILSVVFPHDQWLSSLQSCSFSSLTFFPLDGTVCAN